MSKYLAEFEVKAIQFTDEDSIKAIKEEYPFCEYDEDFKLLVVNTFQGILCMNKGDYIAEVFGSTVIIPANIFRKFYEG